VLLAVASRSFQDESAVTTGPDLQPVPEPDGRELAALFLGSRVLIWVVAGLSLGIVTKGRFYVPHPSPFDWFTRWDAGSFLEIADHGYWAAPGAKSNFPFLPLYPLLVRLCSLGGLVNPAAAAQLVSLASLWFACLTLWRLAVAEGRDRQTATLAVAFLLFGPVSFFFSAPYSEALFLALTLGCFHCLRRERWWCAGGLAALASLTRFAGVVLVFPLLWEAVFAPRPSPSPARRGPGRVVAPLMPLVGFLAYCVFLGLRYGDFLLYFHSEEREWGRHFAWFWLFFSHESFSGLSVFYQVWFSGALLVALVLLIVGIVRRFPVAYSIYGIALVSLYISARLAEALPRYLSVIFPLYLALASVGVRWPRLVIPLLAVSVALESLSVVLFVNGYWFT
jgi:hypothetical protein